VPGASQIFWQGPPAAATARQIAITIDDGYCAECAHAYTALAQATGVHITVNPNGCYSETWNPLAKALRSPRSPADALGQLTAAARALLEAND
jgi:peptidoglycan-N-acetylglucosamine deacetylase